MVGFLERSRGWKIVAGLLMTGPIKLAASNGIVAHAGGGKANATQLDPKFDVHRVVTCATANDSLLMPPAEPGRAILVIQDGAAAARLFGKGTDTIDAVATATGVVLTNANRCWYYCAVAGAWQSLMGVKSA